GLRRRDIIIKFDGKKVTEPDFLADLVEDTEIGDEVEITYLRRGKEKTAMIEIGRKPRSESYGLFFDRGGKSKNKHYQYSFSSSSSGHIGVVVQSLEDQLAEYFGVDDGVLIREVFEDSPAEEAGLKAGDVIVSADGETVEETDDLTEVISDKEEGDKVEIGFMRRGSKKKVTVEVTEDSFGSSYFSAPHMYGHFSIPEIPAIPAIPEIPAIPGIRMLDHFLHDKDDYYFEADEYEGAYKEAMEEYRDEMKDLKRELKEMSRELREIKKKLE
ncbi:MAG: PDZ domain-containing protein, partial [FCB group bacterium]|nr:PDZ domain-containing protein [FCB group bacterium]